MSKRLSDAVIELLLFIARDYIARHFHGHEAKQAETLCEQVEHIQSMEALL